MVNWLMSKSQPLWLFSASSKLTLVHVDLVLGVAELLGHRVGDGRLVALAVRRVVVDHPRLEHRLRGRDGQRPGGGGLQGVRCALGAEARRKPRSNRPSPDSLEPSEDASDDASDDASEGAADDASEVAADEEAAADVVAALLEPDPSRTSSRPGRADRQRRRPSGSWWWTNEDDSWRSSLGRTGGSPVGGLAERTAAPRIRCRSIRADHCARERPVGRPRPVRTSVAYGWDPIRTTTSFSTNRP